MSTTYQQPGHSLDLIAPTGGVTTGVPLLIGALFVVPNVTAAQTLPFTGMVVGVHSYTKTASQAWVQGQAIYWNTSTAAFSSDPSTGPYVGVAVEAVAGGAGDTTGKVKIGFAAAAAAASGAAGALHIRKRFTTAEVNAGATILPAVAGIKYRMLDAALIAVGGAVTTVTTVDILGTLSASSRKLLAAAQANLTQSALLRAGATGGTILADGASFTQNDANTAITIDITGSDITVATHVDVLLFYAADPA
jgi:predicted RecA/RadA family phage recombinase